MVAPSRPAPQPQSVPHPEPRRLWASPDGRFVAHALDWTDQAEPTIEVLARHGRHWQSLAGDELWPCLVAVLLCWDQRAHGGPDAQP